MTNEQIAYELQGINGLLIGLEHYLNKPGIPTKIYLDLREARERVVALAQQFEPLIELECSCGYDPKTGYRRDIVCPKHDGVKTVEDLR